MQNKNFLYITLFAVAIYWLFKSSPRTPVQVEPDEYVYVSDPETSSKESKRTHVETVKSAAVVEPVRSPTQENPNRKMPGISKLGRSKFDLAKMASKSASKKYKDIFPALDIKPWLYFYKPGDFTELVTKFDLEREELLYTLLIDLDKKYSITFRESDSYNKIRDDFFNSDKKSISFLKGGVFEPKNISKIPLNIPICKVNYPDRSKMIEKEYFGRSFRVSKAEFTTHSPFIHGVKIHSVSYSEHPEEDQMIYTIECFVKASTTTDESYKMLNMRHLSATLGMNANLYRFER